MYKIVEIKTKRFEVGKKRIHLEETHSTNAWLLNDKELLKVAGLVVTTDIQTKGRGRLSRVWEGGNDHHLFTSIVIKPDLPAQLLPSVTLLVGLAIQRALSKLGIAGLSIKWPNDILIQGKKVSGILCEMKSFSYPIPQVVIVAGIGLNIAGDLSQFPVELHHKLTTLELETGKQFDKEEILEFILNDLDEVLVEVQSGNIMGLFYEWEQSCSSIGRKVYFDEYGDKQIGTILGINSIGHLRLKNEYNQEIIVTAGEIQFLD
ncbi:MAG: BirA family biotin operon repressor/biotin-[acetyl-CoA-carboxylase] ligase [bacterium]|jgi:BirA family biotin operon repressor/biotin-[acetyl-CoA-carboxylase] ligase